MRVTIMFLGVSLAIAHTAAPAAPLWQKSESGMTASEVRALFPDASVPAKVETLHGGAKCELAIGSYEIESNPYEVCFFFSDGSLTQVALTAREPNYPRFESVIDLLRSKYGSELGSGQPLCKPGSVLKMCEAKWVLKTGTNVSALFMQVGRNEPLMKINYQTRMAKEASKL